MDLLRDGTDESPSAVVLVGLVHHDDIQQKAFGFNNN